MEELEKTSNEFETEYESEEKQSQVAPAPVKIATPRADELQKTDPVSEAASKGKQKVEEVEENLSDVDDDEIQMLILTEEESEVKSKLWHEMNKEYLEEQEGWCSYPFCEDYFCNLLYCSQEKGD